MNEQNSPLFSECSIRSSWYRYLFASPCALNSWRRCFRSVQFTLTLDRFCGGCCCAVDNNIICGSFIFLWLGGRLPSPVQHTRIQEFMVSQCTGAGERRRCGYGNSTLAVLNINRYLWNRSGWRPRMHCVWTRPLSSLTYEWIIVCNVTDSC